MTARWLLLGAATALGAIAATAAGLPAPALLAGVFAGLGYALFARVRLRLPRQVSIGAQTFIAPIAADEPTRRSCSPSRPCGC
jgi:uncharacterized membrane protein AbrB (regulator of aidB expression)